MEAEETKGKEGIFLINTFKIKYNAHALKLHSKVI